MADLALAWIPDEGCADLVIDEDVDDLAGDAGLHTALILSLFADRRAEADDALPAEGGDRRGWWADEFAPVVGDKFGSRLWLLDRSARKADVARDAEAYAREATAWLVEDGVAERVDVEAELGAAPIDLALLVTVHRPASAPVTFRYAHVWDSLA